jgi:endonuclease YncB( thermonuclease family)
MVHRSFAAFRPRSAGVSSARIMRASLTPALALAAMAVLALPGCEAQERIVGEPNITDGDSFTIGRTEIRLFGVDAPEGRQTCTRNGRDWRCGDAAAAELRRLVGGSAIACLERDVDDYGRIVARCTKGNVDLAAAMARSGFAVAYRRYSRDYVDEENEARAARRGLWAGEFTAPEAWRRDGSTEPTAPARIERRDGCSIKGNVNGDGERIYHTPDSPSYRNTGIDESKGERWFCTEAEARRAGWRPPGARRGSR